MNKLIGNIQLDGHLNPEFFDGPGMELENEGLELEMVIIKCGECGCIMGVDTATVNKLTYDSGAGPLRCHVCREVIDVEELAYNEDDDDDYEDEEENEQ